MEPGGQHLTSGISEPTLPGGVTWATPYVAWANRTRTYISYRWDASCLSVDCWNPDDRVCSKVLSKHNNGRGMKQQRRRRHERLKQRRTLCWQKHKSHYRNPPRSSSRSSVNTNKKLIEEKSVLLVGLENEQTVIAELRHERKSKKAAIARLTIEV